ncbi:MAG: hypothetical protein E5Y31_06930 [Mesorhizobium sp.]|nr:MAG: hypothetical protein E5Y31_06930 [Mesorhizobium sp.]
MKQVYIDIIRRYVTDLSIARADALSWWGDLIDKEAAAGTDRQSAEHRCRMRWPMGPASHPRVVAVYRTYFFEIVQANETSVSRYESFPDEPFSVSSLWEREGEFTSDNEQLYISEPTELLYESLEEFDISLFEFMKSFVFLPIGMDATGHLK